MKSPLYVAAVGFATMVLALSSVQAKDVSTFEVRGRGSGGKTPYRGGGAIQFLDASVEAQLVHFVADNEFALPLAIRYKVIQPAPVLLTSRMGTEHFHLYHFGNETLSAMYADEKMDLSETGEHTARSTRAWLNDRYGPLPAAGVVGIRGHYYLLIDQPNGNWLDVTDPPAFFNRPETGRSLTFTLADLSDFSLSFSEVQSTWQPGGPLRVKLLVKDAQGRTFPVVGAPVEVSAGDWTGELTAEWGPLNEPTGWLRGALPANVPETVTVQGTVTAQTPDGRQQREVTAAFQRGEGKLDPQAFQIAEQGYELLRNSDGVVRETRAIWVSTRDIATAEGIDELVARVKAAGLNVIVPDIFVRNTFLAARGPLPLSDTAEEGLDPLGRLIEKAHAAGLEVHPWFCVTYRDRAFREWFKETHGADVDMIDQEGKVVPLGADVHRSAYRDFIVDMMVGVARDYEVDGIHLDYIRTMGRCCCEKCRGEFAKQFGRPLAEASDDDWVGWQQQAIGEIVRRTAEGVRRVRPQAKMSAAVFSNLQGSAAQGQDSPGWANAGWTDIVMPMDYRMQTLQVRANERQFLSALTDKDKLVTGLSLYMREGGKAFPRSSDLVREQITLVRQMGIRGYCLFAYTYLDDAILQMLQDDINSEPAVPVFR